MRTSARRDGRFGHPDARRRHARGRRRRHRLRHDRREDPVHARRPRRSRPAPSCASRSSAPSRSRRARYNARSSRPPSRGSPSSRSWPSRAGFDPASYAGNWRMQLGTLGSGNHFIEVSASTRPTGSGCSCTRAAGRRQQDRAAAHQGRSGADASSGGSTLPDPDLAYLVEGTPEFDRYIAELRWAQRFALLNREEMMDRVVAAGRRVDRHAGARSRSGSTATTTSPSRRRTSASEVWLSRKGAISGATPVGRGSSPVRWARRRTWWRASATRCRWTRRRTAPGGSTRGRRRGRPSRTTAAGGDGGHRVPRHRRLPRRDPAAYKDIDRVMADAADLVSRSGTRCARSST